MDRIKLRRLAPWGDGGRQSETAAPADWRAVVDGLAAGDPGAFDRIVTFVTSYLAMIGAYGLRESWEDLVQEVILALLRNPPQRDDTPAILAFIRRTTYRIYVDQIRREQGRRRRTARDGERPVLGWRREVEIDEKVLSISEEESAFVRLINEGVVDALAQLDDRQREAVEACYLRGLSYQEAARAQRLPLGTFRHILQDGLDVLRSVLAAPDGHGLIRPELSCRPLGGGQRRS